MSTSRTTPSRDWFFSAAVAALAILATACNMEPLGSSLDIADGGLTGIGISGDSILAVGDTIRVQASGSVEGLLGMLSYDPLDDAKWSTANAAVATITPRQSLADETPLARAMVRGVASGTTYVTVSARGFSAKLPIRVVAAAP